MTNKPALYDYLFSGNCYKIRLLLSQLGVEYETRPVDILAGDTKQPAFLQKNPLGQVPVLELADGTCLRESSAILMHLAEGSALLPACVSHTAMPVRSANSRSASLASL